MQRIFLPHTDLGDSLKITEKTLYHQLTRVMRARVGQELVFFDGKNLVDHVYKIVAIDKNSLELHRKESISKEMVELTPRLSLYQALPNKLSKIELLIQKCSEIGYSKIIFFESQRTQKLVISESKKERLEKIAIEAIEQCGGNKVPEISFYGSFEEIVDLNHGGNICKIMCHTDGVNSKKLSDFLKEGTGEYILIVGPEGGFADEELESFKADGYQQVFFGERIMRLETVAPALGFSLSQK